MELEEIIRSIHQVQTLSELDVVFEAFKGRRRELSSVEDSVAKLTFKVGDNVQFNARRRGIQKGRILKMNPSKAQVEVESGVTWNVPYTMLEREEDK